MSTVSAPTLQDPISAVPYIIRVIQSDSAKKGAAAAVAGLLVAAISEALWPSL